MPNLEIGRKYQITGGYTIEASDIWSLGFSESTLVLNNKIVYHLKKLYGQECLCYDLDGNFVGTLQNMESFEFVVNSVYREFPYMSYVTEIIPTYQIQNTHCLPLLVTDVEHYNDALEILFMADNGYSLVNAPCTITMGGIDVTSEYYDPIVKEYDYNGEAIMGTRLYIPNVTDEVQVTIDAVLISMLNVVYNLPTGLEVVIGEESVEYGLEVDVILGYVEVTDKTILNYGHVILAGDVDVTSQCGIIIYTIDNIHSYMAISIPKEVVVADITITPNTSDAYAINGNITGATINTTMLPYNAETRIQITKSNGYTWDDIEINLSMGGISQSYDLVIDEINPNVRYVVGANPVNDEIEITGTLQEEHTFKFYKSNGTLIHQVNTSSIKSLLLRYNADTYTREIVVNGNVVAAYTEVIADTDELKGFTRVMGSVVVYIPVNVDSPLNLKEDTNFYELITTIPTIPTDFKMYLLQNSAENNRVDKTLYLEQVAEITGQLRRGTTIVSPTIDVQMTLVPTFNYVHIPLWNRYYYVSDIQSVVNGLWGIVLKCDVLMSYKDVIRSQVGLIARNEYDYNEDVVDNERSVYQSPNIDVVELENTIFNNTDDGASLTEDKGLRYVITCVKGDK